MKLTVSATVRSKTQTQTWNVSSIVLSLLKPANKTEKAFSARNFMVERHKAPYSCCRRTNISIKTDISPI